MDGPNVNLKYFKEFAADFKEDNFHSLVDIGSCSLHIVHGAFKTGAEKLEWSLTKFLKLLIPYSMTHQLAGRTMSVSLDLQSTH